MVFSNGPYFPMTPETLCIKTWNEWYFDGYSSDDVVEFRLHNPHKAGNGEAFNDFLESVFGMVPEFVDSTISKETMAERITGMLLILIAAAIVGISAAFRIMNVRDQGKLWSFGLAVFSAGGYVMLDVKPGLNIMTPQSLQTSFCSISRKASTPTSSIICWSFLPCAA